MPPAPISLWYFIINDAKRPIGHLSRVVLPSDAIVDDLAEKIKDKHSDDELANVGSHRLTVWRLKEPPTLDEVEDTTAKTSFLERIWPEQLGSTTAEAAIQTLPRGKKLSMYEPWEDGKLHVLVQIPAVGPDPAPSTSYSLHLSEAKSLTVFISEPNRGESLYCPPHFLSDIVLR